MRSPAVYRYSTVGKYQCLITVSTAFILIQQHYTTHTNITHAIHEMCILVYYD